MNFVKSELRDFRKYLYIMAGVFLVALSLNMFLIPAKLAPGGASGIATILYYVAKVPVGVTILVLNIRCGILNTATMACRSLSGRCLQRC